jgi:hypothetical protein
MARQELSRLTLTGEGRAATPEGMRQSLDFLIDQLNRNFQTLSGGIIKLDDCLDPDDNTDLNASTAKHGLLKKLSGYYGDYFRGDGSWAAPPAPGPPPSDTAQYLLMALSGDLPNGRLMTAGTGIAFADMGPGGTLTINATGGSGLTHPQVMNRVAWGF